MARNRMRRYLRHGFIPQLIAFEACLRLQSMTRAAQELALAQPTISGLVRRLSESIGEPLLNARGGRVVATPAGLEVAALCEEVLGSLNRFDERRSQKPRDEKPTKIAPWSHGPAPLSHSKSPPAFPAS
jgi:LysR family transcriptional regulator, low CO2-responsive transcriptional regulator